MLKTDKICKVDKVKIKSTKSCVESIISVKPLKLIKI